MKKQRQDPPLMANRELVELFIGCLTDAFASAVIQYLGNQSIASKAIKKKSKEPSSSLSDDVDQVVARWPESIYD